MMRLLRPAARAISRIKAAKRRAGEAVVFQDRTGAWYAVPIEVLQAYASGGPKGSAPDRLTLHMLGSHGDVPTFGDAAQGLFHVPADLLEHARVPVAASALVERRLERSSRSSSFQHSRVGPVRFVGTMEISYVPDPKDGPSPRRAMTHSPPAGELLGDTDWTCIRRNYRGNGWCNLTGGVLGQALASLADEALGLVAETSNEYELATPRDVPIHLRRRAAKGPRLTEVLHDPAVIATLRAVTGVMLVPTHGSYYFYSGNDHISVHTDAAHCPFALLTRVYGDPPPLISFPALLGCSNAQLRALFESGADGREGEPMHFPPRGGIFFKGCELPHYRPPREAGSPFIGVAQLCYRPVWDKIGATNTIVGVKPVANAPSA